jgi:hypothetical protein
MPFKSEKQKRMFYMARKSPEMRKKMDINLSGVEKMIKHDESPEYKKKKARK